MSILDDVMVNAKAAIDDFGKKATDIADSSALAISANNIKNEIEKKYTELGRIYYNEVKSGSLDLDDLEDLTGEIDILMEQLHAVQAKRASMRNRKICPKCKSAVPKDSSFCNKCGASLEEESED